MKSLEERRQFGPAAWVRGIDLSQPPRGDQPLSQHAQMTPEMDLTLWAEIGRLPVLRASHHNASILPGACA